MSQSVVNLPDIHDKIQSDGDNLVSEDELNIVTVFL